MIEVEETEGGLRVIDAGKNEVFIEIEKWEPLKSSESINRIVDEKKAGYCQSLQFQMDTLHVEDLIQGSWKTYIDNTDSVKLPNSNYLIKIQNFISIYTKFSNSALVTFSPKDETITVRFPEKTPVTLGFQSRIGVPRNQITIPKSPSGMATAISYLSANFDTSSPDRSYPSFRHYPPSINIGDKTSIPEVVRNRKVDTGIVFKVPSRLDYLFVIAPLAYYLQAKVVTERQSDATIETNLIDFSISLKSLPELQNQIANLFERVFYLDCLVRNGGKFIEDLSEFLLVSNIEINPREVYNKSSEERLSKYLDIQFEEIRREFPKWHLTTYIEPHTKYLGVVPHLLDRMSLFFLPEKNELSNNDLVSKSITDPYKFRSETSKPTFSDKFVTPVRNLGRFSSWVGDGIPVDCFKLLNSAIENRMDYLTSESQSKSIVIILNDSDMEEEFSSVHETYRKRAEDFSTNIEFTRQISTNRLLEVFTNEHDFVHFIGHCDEDGLRCVDGNLSAYELSNSRVETFLLNACGSYQEGVGFIEKGSVAGVVTLNDVLDSQATLIGSNFAKLVMHGFPVEQALQLARQSSILGKNYLVIGDGTHIVNQGEDPHPTIVKVEATQSGGYSVLLVVDTLNEPGGYFEPYLSKCKKPHLFGNPYIIELNELELIEYLQDIEIPVIFEDQFFWSDTLAEKLAAHDEQIYSSIG